MLVLYSKKLLKVFPSYRLNPKPLVPNQTFPFLSSKILLTESLTSPSFVVKFLKVFPSYENTPFLSVESQIFPFLSSKTEDTP